MPGQPRRKKGTVVFYAIRLHYCRRFRGNRCGIKIASSGPTLQNQDGIVKKHKNKSQGVKINLKIIYLCIAGLP
jgi:hypothetical protein